MGTRRLKNRSARAGGRFEHLHIAANNQLDASDRRQQQGAERKTGECAERDGKQADSDVDPQGFAERRCPRDEGGECGIARAMCDFVFSERQQRGDADYAGKRKEGTVAPLPTCMAMDSVAIAGHPQTNFEPASRAIDRNGQCAEEHQDQDHQLKGRCRAASRS